MEKEIREFIEKALDLPGAPLKGTEAVQSILGSHGMGPLLQKKLRENYGIFLLFNSRGIFGEYIWWGHITIQEFARWANAHRRTGNAYALDIPIWLAAHKVANA